MTTGEASTNSMTGQYQVSTPPMSAEPILQQRVLPSKSLYVSHFLSTWNTRGFELGAVLFLASIYPGTLMPMSIYALVRAAAAMLLSHKVGQYIDTQERLSIIRTSIVGQRMAVLTSCAAFLLLLTDIATATSIWGKAVFGLLVFLACIEKLCSIMNTVSVERDWVVVIAQKDELILQELNSQMRRIDLFCKLVAPLTVALLDGMSTRIALVVTFFVNACSVGVEYTLIAWVYRMSPALAHRTTSSDLATDSDNHDDGQEYDDYRALTRTRSSGSVRSMHHTALSAMKIYIKSAAFLPSLALSMLYLTVLSFGGQMSTFLLATSEPKITSTDIGFLRTTSTLFEISATFIAPRIMAAIGPVRSGIWCLSWQIMCLSVGVGMLWVTELESPSQRIIIFTISVIMSRNGLWCFDLVAQLLIQNSIDSSQRGSFSTTEAALQNFFELCTFLATIVFPRPEQFKYPALLSLVATCCAAALYAKFVRDRRGHLLHMPDCLKHIGAGGGGGYQMLDRGEAGWHDRC